MLPIFDALPNDNLDAKLLAPAAPTAPIYFQYQPYQQMHAAVPAPVLQESFVNWRHAP